MTQLNKGSLWCSAGDLQQMIAALGLNGAMDFSDLPTKHYGVKFLD